MPHQPTGPSHRHSQRLSRACRSVVKPVVEPVVKPVVEPLELRTLFTTIVVNTTVDAIFPQGSGTTSLRNAVMTADAASTPTTITFDPTVFATAQTIGLDGTVLELSNSADPVTLMGPAAGVTVDGANLSSAFLIDAGVTASLSNFTLTHCNAGAINSTGTLTLDNCTITNNVAAPNAVAAGGIDSTGIATLANVSITNNSNSVSNTSCAGGFYNGGTANLTDVTLSGNVLSASSGAGSSYGGGGFGNGGTATLTRVTLSGNSASGSYGNIGSTSVGGGICNDGTLALVDSTIAGNVGNALSGAVGNSFAAGGLYNLATATLTNVTISDNTATTASSSAPAGGIDNAASAATDFTLGNSIIAGNLAPGETSGEDAVGAFNSLGFNLIGITDGSTGFTRADLSGSAAAPLNPQLGPLADNGGPTQTLFPAVGSPAIGNGNVSYASGLSTDQRGVPRVFNGTVDIGAVESHGSVITQSGSTILATGTSNADTGSITTSNGNVVVNIDGVTDSFALSSITGLNIDLGGGDDSLTIGKNAPPVTIGAGTGADTIKANNSNDDIKGGKGADLLIAGGSGETVSGGKGADTIGSGSATGSTFLGGKGADLFCNNAGASNTINGGTGLNFAAYNPADTFANIFETYNAPAGYVQPSEAPSSLRWASTPTLQPDSVTPALTTLTGGVTLDTLSTGVLKIVGTGGDDSISLSSDGVNLAINIDGNISGVPLAGLPGILLVGGAGDDSLSADSSLTLPLTLRGGAGNDTLTAGGGYAVLVGGAGNDSLTGGSGASLLVPGSRATFTSVPTGNDTLAGGSGASYADFSHRTDALFLSNDGQANSGDTSAGEATEIESSVKNIFGGTGNDTIVSTTPASFLSAGYGTSQITSAGNNTVLTAGPEGSGSDSVTADGNANVLFLMNSHADTYGGTNATDLLQADSSDT